MAGSAPLACGEACRRLGVAGDVPKRCPVVPGLAESGGEVGRHGGLAERGGDGGGDPEAAKRPLRMPTRWEM